MSRIKIGAGGALAACLALGLTDAQAACFCLAHKTTAEVIHFGCEANTRPNRISERVRCLDAERRDKVTIRNHADFDRLAENIGACNPCTPPLAGDPDDIPRKPDTTAATETETSDDP